MNQYSSIFGQILQLFQRWEFQKLVKETKSERHARGFTSWCQFVSMLFCQLGRAHSLREINLGLRTLEGKLVHLGINAPSHSSLAYANEHRPWELYQLIFIELLYRCQQAVNIGKHKFRFNNKLMSLDSTVIDLCLSMYDWAHFRRAKGAIKLHLILDHDGYLPSFAVITEGKVADITIARQLHFDPGTIVVFDRAYDDYALFGHWTDQGVYFVTRSKKNIRYKVVQARDYAGDGYIFDDEIIKLSGHDAFTKCPHHLRRIRVWDEETDSFYCYLTNNLKLAASTIVAIYKERWQIETFFKALKQNLKIKTFVGTSANAVKIQIWTALIAMLILRFLQLRSKYHWSLSNLVACLRFNLLTYRDLWGLLDYPNQTSPPFHEPEQLILNLSG
ncbi:MAG TPA: IS4 family transposase [Dehalococcoidales bacterium]